MSAPAVLFEADARGAERLSDDGRARLDSAMATFVKYPRNTPFVVEGYGRAPTADERYLVSRRRAQLVRDYVVGKFSLDPNFVGVMPMGEEADGSPAGNPGMAWRSQCSSRRRPCDALSRGLSCTAASNGPRR